ncbi:16S rRNA processing protein RimM [candidate division KSB1 bacterium]|nr:16S rRNA processing protein RimM [candidate division KSB1 bacterium]MBL7093293.1 16S rRNA processing protein RimM [candidate division KSB1 bacterium]
MKKRPEFISIGIITKAHGIKGEVLVSSLTDNPEQFETLKHLFITRQDGNRSEISIQQVRGKNDRFIIKISGIDNRNQAESLQKCLIEKRLEDVEDLPVDEYYIFDLIDLNVYTTDFQLLGRIKDVLSLSANDIYVVQGESKEYLIPAIKSIIKKIDLKKEIVLIEPIEGLLDL